MSFVRSSAEVPEKKKKKEKRKKKEFSPVLVFKNSPLQNLRENCGEVPLTETSVLHDKSNYP